MTKKLDPEIKALRALDRALRPLDPAAKKRAVNWLRERTESEQKRAAGKEQR